MNSKYIYLCGPTVYDKVHIGNMRPIVTFDLILRAKKYLDPSIKLIHNITDIDDKIVNKAKELNILEDDIAKQYSDFYLTMLDEYNIKTIDYMPRVSEKIDVIENFLELLIKKDFVYQSNGSYYFRTSKLKTYGEVSNNKLDNLVSEDDNKDKENSFDFALWKNKTTGKTWDISLGNGRPGWHTECAAFIHELTNNQPLLIHGGGIDLKFPHHENENAQFRALTNNPICLEWQHIGIINFKNQKMSKSLGNIIYADDFINKYKNLTISSDLFRLIILSTSINSTIELSDELIDSLIKKVNQIHKIINFVILNNEQNNKVEINKELIENLANNKFSYVYKYLNELVKTFNSSKDIDIAKALYSLIDFLGFRMTLKENIDFVSSYRIKYQQWNDNLKEKNFEQADKLRKELMDKNII